MVRMPPCRFLTKKRYSVSHQSSQLTEDTEVGEKKEREGKGGREGGGKTAGGNKAGKVFEVTQTAKERSKK